MVYDKHTHTSLQCSPASLGLVQDHPEFNPSHFSSLLLWQTFFFTHSERKPLHSTIVAAHTFVVCNYSASNSEACYTGIVFYCWKFFYFCI